MPKGKRIKARTIIMIDTEMSIGDISMMSILEACNSSLIGVYHEGNRISHKILQCGYY